MAELKTKPTARSVEAFLQKVEPAQREDCREGDWFVAGFDPDVMVTRIDPFSAYLARPLARPHSWPT